MKRCHNGKTMADFIPIQGFVSGMIVDKENRYIKILEVKPSAFLFKKADCQNDISDYFSAFLKAAPAQLHFKIMSGRCDLDKPIEKVCSNDSISQNSNRRHLANEYRKRLNFAAQQGISHHFYVSFYEKATPSSTIANQTLMKLQNNSRRIAEALRRCENDIYSVSIQQDNQWNMELFGAVFNRDRKRNRPIDTPEQIYPDSVDTTDPRYLQVNQRYYSFLYIPQYGFPKETVAGWINLYGNSFEGVDADIFINRENKEQMMKKIKHSISYEKTNAVESMEMDDSFDRALDTVNSGYYLKEGLLAGEEIFTAAVLLTVSDEEKTTLEEKITALMDLSIMNGIVLKRCNFHNEEAFLTSLPTSFMDDSPFFKRMKRNMLNSGAASLYPFISNQLQDDNGIYIADHLQNGSPVLLDLFNRKERVNPHMFICGCSGSGKTVALSLLSSRMLIGGNDPMIFILAPEKENEMKRLTHQIGGQFVSLGAGSEKRINIMEIFPQDEGAFFENQLLNGEENNNSLLQQKISSVIEFLQLALGSLSLNEKQMLNEGLITTYKRFGITADNESLWNEEKTAYRKMPVLADLIETLQQNKNAAALSQALRYFTCGAGAYFNGETNVDIENHYFVIGLEHNSDGELPLALYLAMEYCWGKIRRDRMHEKMLICDEWWRFAFQPIAAEKSLKIAKTARAYNCSCVFATQSVDDIFALENGKYGKAVLNNCATRILLKSEEKDIESIAQCIDLSESEKNEIRHFDAGEAYLISGEERLPVRFNPNETEKMLMFTDQKTLEDYVEKKKQLDAVLDNDFVDSFTYRQQVRMEFVDRENDIL